MTPEELAAIEARAAAATPGKWEVKSTPGICVHAVSENNQFHTGCISFDGKGFANAEFIAAARTDIPALCTEIRRLQIIEQAAQAFIEANGPAKYHAFNDLQITMGYVFIGRNL